MQSVIKDLSLTTKLDQRVITAIVNHPFKFLRERIAVRDPRPIRMRNFGVFTPKDLVRKQATNKNKIDILMSEEHVHKTVVYFNVDSLEQASSILETALLNKEYKVILNAYKRVVQNI